MIILRAALGIVFFAHGYQKLLGWFGGYGFDATVQFFQQIRIPSVIAILVILGEFFGGMMGALFTVHLSQGFFIAGGKVGFEYVFSLILMSL